MNTSIIYHTDESDVIDDLLSSNTNERDLIDRLLGCAYGQALGDAYGLATEFQKRSDVATTYPDGTQLIPFPNYVQSQHSSRWSPGDWTDDTDQWLLLMETLSDSDGDVKIFARKLNMWIRHGFPELNDFGGLGLGVNVAKAVQTEGFFENPLDASRTAWESTDRQAAPNGAVMRCSASAFVHYNEIDKMKSTAIQMCKVTHFDPRCVASCVAVCLAIAYIIQSPNDDLELLIDRVQRETLATVGDTLLPVYQEEFLWHTSKDRNLDDLCFDDEKAIGYTFKCLAAGFYGLRSTRSFQETLNDLIRQGGDADTNGAVCGTMYGARYGYKSLPSEWLKAMPYKKWFDNKIITYLKRQNLP
ncbi:unnamed protein product [Rotaria socialis]|uniref:ADP-ribosylglycohydrolase n=1 Tax=Rotaria socialis TaxID=392032 RepID=A0A817YIJ9_9BILA|nr:unnamed protein product [Rotaria socialis]CAF4301456.1 unnamed protein product [Rotaria socialis]